MSQISNVANPQRRNPHCFSDLSSCPSEQVTEQHWWVTGNLVRGRLLSSPCQTLPTNSQGVSSSIPLPRISLSVCPTCLPLPAPINPVLRGKFRLLFFHCLCANSFGFPPYVCHISNSWRLTPVQSWKMKMVSGHHSSHGNDSILIAIVVTLGLTGRARNQYDYNKGNENDVLPAL